MGVQRECRQGGRRRSIRNWLGNGSGGWIADLRPSQDERKGRAESSRSEGDQAAAFGPKAEGSLV
jgi:hypothetical protein